MQSPMAWYAPGAKCSSRERSYHAVPIASDPAVGKKRKQVTYFLAETPFTEITLEQKGGLDDARWFRLQDALELNFYEDVLPIVTKAMQALSKR